MNLSTWITQIIRICFVSYFSSGRFGIFIRETSFHFFFYRLIVEWSEHAITGDWTSILFNMCAYSTRGIRILRAELARPMTIKTVIFKKLGGADLILCSLELRTIQSCACSYACKWLPLFYDWKSNQFHFVTVDVLKQVFCAASK